MSLTRSAVFIFLLAVAAIGCRTAEEGEVRDDLDRRVSVPSPVERIVPLAPSMTEILIAVGAENLIVGVSEADTYPPSIRALPRFQSFPLDFERIIALQPDLLFATDQINNPNDADRLRRTGIETYFFNFERLNDVPRALRATAALIGSPLGEGAARRFEERIRTVSSTIAAAETRPRVLVLIGDAELYAFGGRSYVNEMIALAGGESVTAHLEGPDAVLSDEFVLSARPEVILGLFGPGYDPGRLLANHPTWHLLPAFQQNRVYSIDPDLFVRPGPRLADGVEFLARRLHPTLFAEGIAYLGGVSSFSR